MVRGRCQSHFFNQKHSQPNKTLNTLPEREVFALWHSKRAHLLAAPAHLCMDNREQSQRRPQRTRRKERKRREGETEKEKIIIGVLLCYHHSQYSFGNTVYETKMLVKQL